MNRPHVLIVEDETRLRELLARAIRSWDFDVTEARSGEDALKLIAQQPMAIALLDINLPGMSGIELFEALRERDSRTEVIILTGFGDLEAAKKAIRLDVVDFLTKPCHLGELEVALDRARRRWLPVPVSAEEEGDSDTDERPSSAGGETDATLEDIERRHILSVLEKNKGNRTASAAELGISRRTLQYRLNEYQKKGLI